MRYFRLFKRSAHKVADDLDILKIIRRQRQHQAALFGLLTKHQRKFLKMEENFVLSEFSTPNEDSSDSDRPQKSPKVGNQTKKDPLDFINEIVQNGSESNIRFLKLYEKQDLQRQRKWLNTDPKNLIEANVRRFKYLLARNLSGKTDLMQNVRRQGRIEIIPVSETRQSAATFNLSRLDDFEKQLAEIPDRSRSNIDFFAAETL